MTEKAEHIIDAKGKKLGRIATEAVVVLMGKDTPDFERHIQSKSTVMITNASQMEIDEKKKDQKEYIRFSGYPGGQKREVLKDLLKRKGYEEVIRKAVYGMLPNNRLRRPTMKRLIVSE